MNPIVFAAVALRVVAVYLIAQGLIHLPSLLLIEQIEDPAIDGDFIALQIFLVTLMPLVVGSLLWKLAPKLGRTMVDTEHQGGDAATALQIQTVAISTAGLILLFASLPTMATNFYNGVIQAEMLEGVRYYNEAWIGYLVGSGLQALLALFLIVGAGILPRVLYRIRAVGRSQESSNNALERPRGAADQ